MFSLSVGWQRGNALVSVCTDTEALYRLPPLALFLVQIPVSYIWQMHKLSVWCVVDLPWCEGALPKNRNKIAVRKFFLLITTEKISFLQSPRIQLSGDLSTIPVDNHVH